MHICPYLLRHFRILPGVNASYAFTGGTMEWSLFWWVQSTKQLCSYLLRKLDIRQSQWFTSVNSQFFQQKSLAFPIDCVSVSKNTLLRLSNVVAAYIKFSGPLSEESREAEIQYNDPLRFSCTATCVLEQADLHCFIEVGINQRRKVCTTTQRLCRFQYHAWISEFRRSMIL